MSVQSALANDAMAAKSDQTWERAQSYVDQQINGERQHVWPFGGTYPIDVRFLILDRRRNVPVHRPDHLEIVVFESGKLGYEVGDRCCSVGKQDILVVSDRLRHRCFPIADSQAEARTVVLSFLPRTLHMGAPTGDDFEYLMPFNIYGPIVSNVIPAKTRLAAEMVDLIRRIGKEIPEGSERSRLAIRTYLKMLLLQLVGHCSEFREARVVFNKRSEARERLAPIFEHLHHHYEEPIRVTEAARLCGVSSCCFMSLFKDITGQSFVAYLNGYRVLQAKSLLASTRKPISEVSLQAGFCNQSYFTMIFRRLTTMTPLAYRLQRGEAAGANQTAVSPPSTVKIPPTQ
jgi:AraC family transcriptional regulator, transcriptional activator of pobA